MTLRDVDVETVRMLYDRQTGAGLQVIGSTVDGARLRVADTVQDGILVNDGSEVVLRELEVVGVSEATCETDCEGAAGGRGLTVYGGARLAVHDVQVSEAVFAGVAVVQEGRLELSEGSIRDCGIGVLDDDSSDVVLEEVSLEDNDIDFQQTSISLPEPLMDIRF